MKRISHKLRQILKERVHENDSFKSMNQESIIKPNDENLSKYMPNADVDFAEEKTTEKRKRGRSVKHRATETGDSDTGQGQSAQRRYLTAAEIGEEEEPEDMRAGRRTWKDSSTCNSSATGYYARDARQI